MQLKSLLPALLPLCRQQNGQRPVMERSTSLHRFIRTTKRPRQVVIIFVHVQGDALPSLWSFQALGLECILTHELNDCL